MKVFYNPIQKNHILSHEIISGKRFKHNEKSTRIDVILKTLKAHGGFEYIIPDEIPMEAITAVHDKDYIDFLSNSPAAAREEIIWPYVFPYDSRIPLHDPANPLTAGYYCFDVGTPIMGDTWYAALAAVSGAWAGAKCIHSESQFAYALARPPGHHASQNKFGGYCYINNAAVAGKYLANFGKVLIIDIDYHHGNGTQSIFYNSDQVTYLSLHGDPSFEFPYFSGHKNEIGVNAGEGFNFNYPLAKYCGPNIYFENLDHGLQEILKRTEFEYIVISAGFDIALGEPLGHLGFREADFLKLGQIIKSLNKKTLIVQEGGYFIENLGKNVLAFLSAFI